MGIKSKIKTWFFLDDEYMEAEEEDYPEFEPGRKVNETGRKVQKNVVSLKSVQQSSKVILIEPRIYADAQDVADHLKNRRAVIVNLQQIEEDQARRIVDFLSGTIYAINGDIQKIGNDIFLCVPDNVEVSGSISADYLNGELNDKGW